MKRVLSEGLVSIITPAYNSEKYISDCIDSVLNQTYENWEMIVVNDKSSDKTQEIVESYTNIDSRIRLINLSENSGAAVARNTALDAAKGRYVAFLDSDDRWKKNKLELQLEFMNNHTYGFSFTSYEYILDENNNTHKLFPVPVSLSFSQALKHTVIGCLTVIIDKEIIGDFRMPLVRRGQDNLTWLMILKKGFIAYGLNASLAEYRKVKGSLSNNKIIALKRQWHNYRHIIELPLHTCIYYYFFYALYNVKKYYFK